MSLNLNFLFIGTFVQNIDILLFIELLHYTNQTEKVFKF